MRLLHTGTDFVEDRAERCVRLCLSKMARTATPCMNRSAYSYLRIKDRSCLSKTTKWSQQHTEFRCPMPSPFFACHLLALRYPAPQSFNITELRSRTMCAQWSIEETPHDILIVRRGRIKKVVITRGICTKTITIMSIPRNHLFHTTCQRARTVAFLALACDLHAICMYPMT